MSKLQNFQPKITIIDSLSPEDLATLQALYSRDPGSIEDKLDQILKPQGKTFRDLEKTRPSITGKTELIKNYYIGYGHASIADCGNTTLFIEGVSMQAAKALQNFALYNGQEASTRYIDFSKQAVIAPNLESVDLQKQAMELYQDTLAQVIAGITSDHPFEENKEDLTAIARTQLGRQGQEPTDEKVLKMAQGTYNKAIKAKAFDITRALLPIGTTTSLSWTGSLRSFGERCAMLQHHPLEEIRQLSTMLLTHLREVYPSSFSESMFKETPGRKASVHQIYKNHSSEFMAPSLQDLMARYPSLLPNGLDNPIFKKIGTTCLSFKAFDSQGFKDSGMAQWLAERVPFDPIPDYLASFGVINAFGLLDFGSVRDLERHRPFVRELHIPTADFGLMPWYDHEFETYLKPEDYQNLKQRMADIDTKIRKTELSLVEKSYLIRMGTMTLWHMAGTLDKFIYLSDRRTQMDVHPTARSYVQSVARQINAEFNLPKPILIVNEDEVQFSLKRGTADIIQRDEKKTH